MLKKINTLIKELNKTGKYNIELSVDGNHVFFIDYYFNLGSDCNYGVEETTEIIKKHGFKFEAIDLNKVLIGL